MVVLECKKWGWFEMKQLSVIVVLLAMVLGVVIGMTGCTETKPAAKTETPGAAVQGIQYTCTMHPEVISDKPGNCPKCGMNLVEKK